MYHIAGFEFETEEQALAAKKEVEAVRYIKEQMNMDDPEVLRRLYQKLVAQNVFETPVGLAFLSEIKDYIQHGAPAQKEDVQMQQEEAELQSAKEAQALFAEEKEAEVEREARKEAIRQEKENLRRAKNMEKTSNAAFRENQLMRENYMTEEKQKKLLEKYQMRFQVSLFCAIVLGVVVIGMFIITFISKDNINIINYENKLIDRYQVWEQELKEREEAIEKKEAELGIQIGE